MVALEAAFKILTHSSIGTFAGYCCSVLHMENVTSIWLTG